MTGRPHAVLAATALAVVAGCHKTPTSIVLDVDKASDVPHLGALDVTILGPTGALARGRVPAAGHDLRIPGTVVVDLPDDVDKVATVVTGLTENGSAGVDVAWGFSDFVTVGAGVQMHVAVKLTGKRTDTDGDGIPDVIDNCPTVANADQRSSTGMKPGDACRGKDAGGGGADAGGGAADAGDGGADAGGGGRDTGADAGDGRAAGDGAAALDGGGGNGGNDGGGPEGGSHGGGADAALAADAALDGGTEPSTDAVPDSQADAAAELRAEAAAEAVADGVADAAADAAVEGAVDAACTTLLSDDFETGDFSRWDGYLGTAPTVTTTAPLEGTHSLMATAGTLSAIAKDFAPGLPKVRLSLMVDVSAVTSATLVYPSFGLFTTTPGSEDPVVVYVFHNDMGCFIRPAVHDTGTMSYQPPGALPMACAATVTLEWTASSAVTSGSFRVLVDGVDAWDAPLLNNTGDTVQEIGVGAYGADGSTGTIKIDHVVVDDCGL